MKTETEIIKEVRALTSKAVAKKQDSAKANYPMLLTRIKDSASRGEHHCTFNTIDIDEHSKRLLEADGFSVTHMHLPIQDRAQLSAYLSQVDFYQWRVSW